MTSEFIWISDERDHRNHLELIRAALDKRLLETKQRNPRGFLDQFEQQLDIHFSDIAQELRASLSYDAEARPVLSFVPGYSAQSLLSNPGLKKEGTHA